MPTYDYQCRDCGTVTEVIHGMTEDGPTVCEACGGPLRRVLYPAGIIFKGSGFYRTDSRAAASAAASKGSSEPATTGDGGAASKDGGSSAPASTGTPSTSTEKKSAPSSSPAD